MVRRKTRKDLKVPRPIDSTMHILRYSAASLVIIGSFGLVLSSFGNPSITGYAVLRPDVQASANILLLLSALAIIAGIFLVSHSKG